MRHDAQEGRSASRYLRYAILQHRSVVLRRGGGDHNHECSNGTHNRSFDSGDQVQAVRLLSKFCEKSQPAVDYYSIRTFVRGRFPMPMPLGGIVQRGSFSSLCSRNLFLNRQKPLGQAQVAGSDQLLLLERARLRLVGFPQEHGTVMSTRSLSRSLCLCLCSCSQQRG